MNTSLLRSLQSNPSMLLAATACGPVDSSHMMAVALCNMTQVPCDAYVVPHSIKGASFGGVAGTIYNAGAKYGLDTYEEYRQKNPFLRYGDAKTTDANGGNSASLINVVGIPESGAQFLYQDAYDRVQKFTFASMAKAREKGFRRIVVPPLGVEEFGGLTLRQSAMIIFVCINTFWRVHREEAPSEVVLALDPAEISTADFHDIVTIMNSGIR
ncbi:MAG: hypothetical protein HN337_09650 [Deltaproteobacteria bacterium]|nr:hypothetical protein [Deltaproteobacteria bacterium]